MLKAWLTLLFSLIVLNSCAHRPTDSSQSSSVAQNDEASVTDEESAKEDAAIQKLPQTKSDFGANGIIMDAIPIEVNSEVERWLSYFQGRGRGHFERYLERSTRYIPLMKKILRENGVPEDLVYIAMIESGFTGKIRSRARAVGYWQFISGTGKHYKLKSNKWVDERWDPVRSTEAAALYFKGLYNLFGDWFLAIASYNVGENRVKSLVMKNFTRDFWELARRKKLPDETIHYIPKFIAASLMAREPEKYGFRGLDYQAPLEFEVVTSKDPIDLRIMAKGLKVEYDVLTKLNPAWKTQYVIPLDGDAKIRVPVGRQEDAKQVLAEAVVKNKRFVAQDSSAPDKINLTHYKIKKGDTLSEIADRFEVSVEDLRKVNPRIRNGKLRPGRSIKIPSSAFDVNPKTRKSSARNLAVTPSKKKKGKLVYTVRRGDTLIGIARRHGVDPKDLIKQNRLAANPKVQRGQKLVISSNN